MDTISDRRIKPRINCDYPAIIEGYDSHGNNFKQGAKLENLSASGLFMMADCSIEPGAKLAVTILLSNTSIEIDTPRIATSGIVVRTEPQIDGSCGIAVKFNKYKFL
jgi:NDP-sugar pyrophosphorylase family protein